MEIFRTKLYARKCRKLLSAVEQTTAEGEVLVDPEAWPVIAGTGGVRKARSARGNSGKSGGVRILYYVWLTNDRVFFMDIYAKNQKENITDSEKAVLKEIVQAFREEYNG